MVTINNKGDFSKTLTFFDKVRRAIKPTVDDYAQQGVELLAAATPVKSGLTASSWYYEIEETSEATIIHFCNSNIQNGYANVAILLQYGHATKNGGWVEGIDYINPVVQPLFDKLAKKAWKGIVG